MREAYSGYRNVLAVVAALTLVQAATAGLLVLVALTLKDAGASNLAVGAVASGYSCGFILGALLSPWEIARVGHIRAYALFAAVAAIIALTFALRDVAGPQHADAYRRHTGQRLVVVFLAVALALSAFWYPVVTAMSVPYDFWRLHNWLPTWV